MFRRNRKMNSAQRVEAVRLYQEGLGLNRLASMYGVAVSSMHQMLSQRIVLRPKTQKGKDNSFYRGGSRSERHVSAIVRRAIKAGHVQRKEACEVCGGESLKLDAHHCDYNKPLDLMWLCRKCHIDWHRRNQAVPLKERPLARHHALLKDAADVRAMSEAGHPRRAIAEHFGFSPSKVAQMIRGEVPHTRDSQSPVSVTS